MGKARWMMGSLLGAALVMGSVAPAEARPRYGYGGYQDRYRHHDGGFGFGDAVGVAALIGAVAIVASSMSKDRDVTPGNRDRNRDADAPPPMDGTDYGSDVEATDNSSVDHGSADQYADACADAAREEASGDGGYAEVRKIDEPIVIDGGYNIDGEVESRATYADAAGSTRRFTCTIKSGRVAEVYLSRDLVTR